MRLETPRLVLRRWRAEDLAPLAVINADPDVAFWLGGPRDRAGSDASAAVWEAAFTAHGFGRFAIERDGELIGVCGLMPVRAELAFPGVEIGWRLARQAGGRATPPRRPRRRSPTASRACAWPRSSPTRPPRTGARAR